MFNQLLERLFKLQQHGTTIRTEVIAGLTTFAAMSYILVVNPGILGLSGMPVEGLITVTAIAACLGTLLDAGAVPCNLHDLKGNLP
ncbi:solute carrier family 23 protein [uncultured Sulfitobacter sp.]|uniref:solute carrier family 23 protein n=1 Tax=uncultured Sulfitobacter sp. TaxID=191468 RepID=UPI00259148B9|nr:solute carrier family 23 protein [uncultured Sulfitobacter sp.]